ncbi:hypothetical protein D5S09_11215 [Lactobacillus sp. LMY-20]|nr:hypothetical protein [Lactobacillus sp. LMY-20]
MGLETVHLFHGTYKKNAMSIIQRGFTTTDIPDIGKINTGNAKKKPGSLGFGLYGFRDDPCLALDYIKRVCTGNDYEVLHFDIQLHRDNKLNFVNSVNDMMAFQQWKELPARKKLLDILKKKYSNNVKQHSLDGAILEAYIYDMTRRKEFKEPIYAVCSATHTPTDPESENRSISMIPNGIEYAVRNTIIINNDSIDTVGTSSNQLEE